MSARPFLGVDPGLDGAVAYWDPVLDVLHVEDMPTMAAVINGAKKRLLNPIQFRNLLQMWDCPARAVLEDVHSMPAQGIASAFTFGRVLGNIEAVLLTSAISVHYVKPAVWKRVMNVTADKTDAIAKATRLFPQHAHLWPLKKHDGRAEAALLAYYGANYA